MPSIAPYGSWRSPIDAGDRSPRAGRRLGAPTLAGDGAVWWAEGRPAEGGRVVLMRRGRPGGEPEDGDAGGDQRPHPGPRVRRRRLVPGRAPTSSSSSTSPTSGSTGSGWARSRSRSRPSPTSPGGLRYADMRLDPGRAHGRLRARDPRRGRSGEPDRRPGARRLRRAAGARLRARLLLLPAGQPRRRAGSPGPAGTTRTCPGTGPSSGWRRSRTRPTRAWSPAAPRSRSSSPSGTPRAACTSSPTATAGGTSTATTAAGDDACS